MRRFVFFGTAAAAAAVLLLPAAAAWLRQPVAQPLPEPVRLQGLPETQKPEVRRSSRRERSSPLSRSRSARRTSRQEDRVAAAGARHVVLALVAAGRSPRSTPSPSSGHTSPAPRASTRRLFSSPDSARASADREGESDDMNEDQNDSDDDGDSS